MIIGALLIAGFFTFMPDRTLGQWLFSQGRGAKLLVDIPAGRVGIYADCGEFPAANG